MSQSSSNTRAPSPPPPPDISTHGGRRRISQQKEQKKRRRAESVATATAAHVANSKHRKRLAECIHSLSNPSGRSLSSNELRIIIRLAMWLQLYYEYSEAAAIDAASVWCGSGRMTIGPAYHHYWETNELIEVDSSNRGSGNPLHPRHTGSLTPDVQMLIHSILAEARLVNAFVPAREVMRRAGVQVSERHARRMLRQLGYKWRRKRPMGTASKEQMAQRMRSFIHQYSDALKQEEDGVAVIIYTDESYIHTHHRNRYMWALSSDEQGTQVRGTPSKGERLIIMHAMGKDGLLHAPRRGRSASLPTNVLSDIDFTCEVIFKGTIDSEDYHKNMDGTTLMNWINNRLIPSFKRRYPNKKLILVLDNASYHHPRGEDWVNPNKMKKQDLAAWIVSHLPDGQLMRVQDGDRERVFGKSSLFSHGSKYSPTCKQMRLWIKAYLLKHPHINQTLLQQEFTRHGFQLIYTPPYQCDVQPIEMLWAYVKNYVGRVMGDDHSVKTVTELTRQGFYGDQVNNHAPADAIFCQSIINHTHKWLNKWIERDEELSGDIHHVEGVDVESVDVWNDLDDAEEEQQNDASDQVSDEESKSDTDS